METKEVKYVMVLQCQIATERCSGLLCEDSFHKRIGPFAGYEPGVRFLTFTCGGCSGKATSRKLTEFLREVKKKSGIEKEEVVLHFASCIVTDNWHYDRCPHFDYLKNMVEKRAIRWVEGSHLAKTSQKRREEGKYKTY